MSRDFSGELNLASVLQTKRYLLSLISKTEFQMNVTISNNHGIFIFEFDIESLFQAI